MPKKVYKNRATRRLQILEYLGNPLNPFVNRSELACAILGYKTPTTMYAMFTPDELAEIEVEALKIRRSKYTADLARIDTALKKVAEAGDVAAAKLCFQRYEGWSEKKEIKGNIGLDLGGKIEIVLVTANAPFSDTKEESDA